MFGLFKRKPRPDYARQARMTLRHAHLQAAIMLGDMPQALSVVEEMERDGDVWPGIAQWVRERAA